MSGHPRSDVVVCRAAASSALTNEIPHLRRELGDAIGLEWIAVVSDLVVFRCARVHGVRGAVFERVAGACGFHYPGDESRAPWMLALKSGIAQLILAIGHACAGFPIVLQRLAKRRIAFLDPAAAPTHQFLFGDSDRLPPKRLNFERGPRRK